VSQPPLKIQVLPQPASYPQAAWLPAQAVTLDYEWHGNPQALSLGEPLTLQIEFKAKGLSQAQLPEIVLAPSKGFKYYPDQAKTQDVTTEEGIIGVRSQSIAIVPTEVGSRTLPEIRIPWWNTQHGRIEYAVIPAQRLTTFNNNPTQENSPVNPEPMVPTSQADNSTQQAPTSSSLLWPLVSLGLLVLWLATLGLWWAKSKETVETPSSVDRSTPLNPRLKDIRQACRDNDASQARAHILNWARSQWQFDGNSLSNLAKQIEEPALKEALVQLDNFLYSPVNDSWQGEYLWQLLRAHKPVKTTKPKGSELTTLYPGNTAQASHG